VHDVKENSSNTNLILRYMLREVMGVVILILILFLSAGRWDWLMGWVLVAMTFLWATATGLILIFRNPDLLADRLGPKKGAKYWDTLLMSSVGLLTLARSIMGGFDERYAWSTGISSTLQISMAIVASLGYILVLWATASNPFFSQIFRIQVERDHTVAKGGPYQFVRHPAYVGTILFELAVPIMLGSWWALIPGGLNALLFILRTALEDRTLMVELEGYSGYAENVRYRLVRGIW
jgi:protein-S-isoprenylcysteine O-methyltransferase Ste14